MSDITFSLKNGKPEIVFSCPKNLMQPIVGRGSLSVRRKLDYEEG
jgi:hypothetical protein